MKTSFSRNFSTAASILLLALFVLGASFQMLVKEYLTETTVSSLRQDAQILSNLVNEVWEKVECGQIKPTIHKILPIEQAEAAHDILYRGENVGKVVLKVC